MSIDPRDIARLITEDPDVAAEQPSDQLAKVFDKLMNIGYKFLNKMNTPENDMDIKIAKDIALGVLDNIKLFVRTGKWSWDDPSYEGWQDGDDEYTVAFKSSSLLPDYKNVLGMLIQLSNDGPRRVSMGIDKQRVLQLIEQLRDQYFDVYNP